MIWEVIFAIMLLWLVWLVGTTDRHGAVPAASGRGTQQAARTTAVRGIRPEPDTAIVEGQRVRRSVVQVQPRSWAVERGLWSLRN